MKRYTGDISLDFKKHIVRMLRENPEAMVPRIRTWDIKPLNHAEKLKIITGLAPVIESARIISLDQYVYDKYLEKADQFIGQSSEIFYGTEAQLWFFDGFGLGAGASLLSLDQPIPDGYDCQGMFFCPQDHNNSGFIILILLKIDGKGDPYPYLLIYPISKTEPLGSVTSKFAAIYTYSNLKIEEAHASNLSDGVKLTKPSGKRGWTLRGYAS